jgi:hypothetical protein
MAVDEGIFRGLKPLLPDQDVQPSGGVILRLDRRIHAVTNFLGSAVKPQNDASIG